MIRHSCLFASFDGHDIRYLLESCNRGAQGRQILDFDADVHDDLHRFLVGPTLEFDDIGVVIGEHGGDVANKSAAIKSVRRQVNRVGTGFLLAPADRDYSLRMAAIEA